MTATYIPKTKQAWTQLDAIALLNGISTWDKDYMSLSYVRLPSESQVDLRNKISRMHEYKAPDTSLQSLMNGLSAELDLVPTTVKTKNWFELTYFPIKLGDNDVNDISIFYLTDEEHPELTNSWTEIDTFIDKDTPVPACKIYSYDNEFWSKNIILDLPQLTSPTYLKFIYTIKEYDENNNPVLSKFTDVSSNIVSKLNKDNDPFVYVPCSQPFINLNTSELDQLVVYSLNDMDLVQVNDDYLPSSHWLTKSQTGATVATSNLLKLQDLLDKGNPKYKDVSDYSTMWDINNDQLCIYDNSLHITNIKTIKPLEVELTGGVDKNSKSLLITNIIDDSSSWKLQCRSGEFYISGKKYYLFSNPVNTTAIEIELDSNGIGIIPSYVYTETVGVGENAVSIKKEYIHKKIIVLRSEYDLSTNLNIVPDYNYPIIETSDTDRTYFEGQLALRNSLIECSDGYYIDYVNNTINVYDKAEVGDFVYLVMDDSDLPEDVILNYNINPITNTSIQNVSFIVSLLDK